MVIEEGGEVVEEGWWEKRTSPRRGLGRRRGLVVEEGKVVEED